MKIRILKLYSSITFKRKIGRKMDNSRYDSGKWYVSIGQLLYSSTSIYRSRDYKLNKERPKNSVGL